MVRLPFIVHSTPSTGEATHPGVAPLLGGLLSACPSVARSPRAISSVGPSALVPIPIAQLIEMMSHALVEWNNRWAKKSWLKVLFTDLL
jgi:hypothetical protein